MATTLTANGRRLCQPQLLQARADGRGPPFEELGQLLDRTAVQGLEPFVLLLAPAGVGLGAFLPQGREALFGPALFRGDLFRAGLSGGRRNGPRLLLPPPRQRARGP